MNKKRILAVFSAAFLITAQRELSAAPYFSFMIDRDGFYRSSPDLYEPSHIVDYDISGVNDMFIDEQDRLYIARLGPEGAEVLVFDAEEQFVRTVGGGVLRGASGVFADSGGLIYVADDAASAVFVFSPEGETLRRIGRPVSPLFGAKTPFKPVKVMADRQGNMYILGEGSTNGIIQLDGDGGFLGYFGVSAARVSLIRRVQNMLFPPEMMANFIRTQPPSMTNIAIDREGLVYAVTKGDTLEPLKKINIAGKNLLDDSLARLYGEPALLSLESVTTDRYGNMYALSGMTGHIIILDSQGGIAGIFGAKSEHSAELGITVSPVAVGINSKQTIYVADKGTGQIQVFSPTPLMNTLFSALALYREGRYVESEGLWQETLSRNAAIAVAHHAIGMALTKKEQYPQALAYFKLANNRQSYSAAFWEVRQRFLLQNLRRVIAGLCVFWILRLIWNQVHKRSSLLNGYFYLAKQINSSLPARKFREVTLVFRHPVDAFYNLSHEGAVPVSAACGIVIPAITFLLLSDYLTGFIFNEVNTSAGYLYSPFRAVIIYTAGFLLFVASNFLIASITGGNGSLSQVFRASALALAPTAFLYPLLILFSNILTLQEQFFYNFVQAGIFGWSGLLVIIMVMQVHDFDLADALRNIALTLFTMAVIFVIAMVIYILSKAAVDFFASIFEEAFNRV
jgi:DNA-binding beta-propeller fold protein YncE